MKDLIQRTFLRGYKTGLEAAQHHTPAQVVTFQPPYKIGQVLEDGYIYAGFYQTDKESYHIALAPKDEPAVLNWENACRLDIPTKNEWSLISINKDLFNLKSSCYWSSTEYTNYNAVLYDTQYGYMYSINKTTNNLVRCVRRFGHSTI